MKNKKLSNGFTIIEVVLVLAVAGLLFLIVFLALPQLQRIRRNHVRKTHANMMLGAIETYIANNGGVLPGQNGPVDLVQKDIDNALIVNNYLPDDLRDPSTGGPYIPSGAQENVSFGPSISGLGYIDWFTGARCTTGGVFEADANYWNPDRDIWPETKITVVIGLEPGDFDRDGWLPGDEPQGLYYCVDNS